MEIRDSVSYQDVLLVPRYSGLKSTKDANVNINYSKLPKPFECPPIINAPMDKVCSYELLNYLHNERGFPVTIHRYFQNSKEQLEYLEKCNFNKDLDLRRVFVSVGSIHKWREWIDELIEEQKTRGYSFLVDMANGDCDACLDTVKYIREELPEVNIMAGNVATKAGFERLYKNGANLIRCGVGSGSICSTRLEIGFGVPVLTSVMDCYNVKPDDAYIIADGGITNDGDIMKAMAGGADMIMMGKQFAATDLSPGDFYDSNKELISNILEDVDEIKYKDYRGMSSKEARNESPCRKSSSVEGVSGLIEYFGTTEEYVNSLLEHMKTALSYYAGQTNWKDFRRKTKFVRLSSGGWEESKTHVVDKG
jgi:IMP dehydrogenase